MTCLKDVVTRLQMNGKDVAGSFSIDDRKQRVAKGLRFWRQAATTLLVLPSRGYPSDRHLVGV